MIRDQRYSAALRKLWRMLQRNGVSRAAYNTRLAAAFDVQPDPRDVMPVRKGELVAPPLLKGLGGVSAVDSEKCKRCEYVALTPEQYQTALRHGVRVNSRDARVLPR